MNALAKTDGHSVILRPQTFNELLTFANMAAKLTMVPADYRGKPENVMLAVQMGSELGLAPMQALQNIAVINGRPSVWGDAMPGLCRQSPVCDDIEERIEGSGDTMTAVCIAKRVGKEPVVSRFSVDDAKKAGLWNKQGPWQQYPKRMLQMRARGFALRDAFPDVLRGLISAEEASDMPTKDTFTGQTIDAAPQTRETINEETHGAPTETAEPTPVERYPGLFNEPDGNKWLVNLQGYLNTAASEDEVAEIGGLAPVTRALSKAPSEVKRDINAALASGMQRFVPENEVA